MERSRNHQKPPLSSALHHTRLGVMVIITGFLGFLAWAAFAPLDKGVASSGVVTVTGNRKVVQSPQTGLIKTIFATEGQSVREGEPLIALNKIENQAQVDTLRSQYLTAKVTEARLLAEHDGLNNIVFSLPEDKKELAQVVPLLSLQNRLLKARRHALSSEINSYQHTQAGNQLQLTELRQAKISKKFQQSTLREQVANLRTLAEEGYLPRNRYLELQRQLAEINANLFETQGQIALLKEKDLETEQRIAQRKAEYQQDIATQLAQTQSDKLNYENQLKAATLALHNTLITSPVSGKVTGLTVFTLGGTVSQGQQLMDILPVEAPLIVDARLQTALVDKVHPGLPVDIMFTAFNQNTTPKVPGVVSLISADRLTDTATGEPYYQMLIEVTPEGKKQLAGLDVKAGMPVEVFIKTGARTLLSYFFKPIADRASTSLAEE